MLCQREAARRVQQLLFPAVALEGPECADLSCGEGAPTRAVAKTEGLPLVYRMPFLTGPLACQIPTQTALTQCLPEQTATHLRSRRPAPRGRHLLWQETRQPSSVSVLEAFSRSLELECLRHQGNARGHLTHLRKHHPESGSGRVREKKIVTTVGRHPRPCSKINSNFWNQQRLKIQHHPGQFTLGVGEVFLLQAKTHLEMLVTRCWSRLDHGGARADNNDDGRRLPRTRRPYPLREADQAGMSAGRMKCCALR